MQVSMLFCDNLESLACYQFPVKQRNAGIGWRHLRISLDAAIPINAQSGRSWVFRGWNTIHIPFLERGTLLLFNLQRNFCFTFMYSLVTINLLEEEKVLDSFLHALLHFPLHPTLSETSSEKSYSVFGNIENGGHTNPYVPYQFAAPTVPMNSPDVNKHLDPYTGDFSADLDGYSTRDISQHHKRHFKTLTSFSKCAPALQPIRSSACFILTYKYG
jgi:hypothetical protein